MEDTTITLTLKLFALIAKSVLEVVVGLITQDALMDVLKRMQKRMVFLFYVLAQLGISSFQTKRVVGIAMNVVVSAEDMFALKFVPIQMVDTFVVAEAAILHQMVEELAII